jgi:hypothetical protein
MKVQIAKCEVQSEMWIEQREVAGEKVTLGFSRHYSLRTIHSTLQFALPS